MSQNIVAASHRDGSAASRQRHAHGWEDWEDDDDVITLIDMNEPTPAYAAKEAAVMRNKSRSPAGSSSRFSLSPTNDSPPGSIMEHPPLHPPLSHRPGQGLTVPSNPSRNIKRLSARASRHVMGRISRPTSRRRQKSATSTLRLITDMSKFRRTNHVNPQTKSPEVRPPKFVDAAALAALEGEPTSASTGNWSWLKRSRLQSPETTSRGQTVRSPDQELSPEDRPIVIGIALPSDEAASHEMSPQTAAASSHPPIDQQMTRLVLPGLATGTSNPFADASQPKSVWSPDTPDTACSFNSIQRSSSVYSQMTIPGLALGSSHADTNVPPVPALPANYKQTPQKKVVGEEESGSPCTLFEEDATPTVRRSLRSMRGKLSAVTPCSATSQGDGWWDHHLVTPFLDRTMSLASRVQKGESSVEEKGAQKGPAATQVPKSWEPQESLLLLPPLTFQSTQYMMNAPGGNTGHQLDLGVDNGLGISFPTTDGVSVQGNRGRQEQGDSSFSTTTISEPKASSQQSKPTAAVTDAPRTKVSDWDETAPGEKSHRLAGQAKVDIPPPYSPLRLQAAPVSYQAVFPPDHATKTHIQSRHKGGAPGLASTLTSQGVGRGMDHVPAKPVTKRSIEENTIPGPSSALQANNQATAIVQLPEQSRFSGSPSSIGSSTLGDGSRPTERHIVAAHPVEGESGFYHDLESLPRNPARPYLAHEPTAPPEPSGYGYTMALPARQAGTFLPEEHGHDARGKVERQRRRHEKEDVVARRVGGFWRGRGCVPSRGCFGRSGREGRKKRRIWVGVTSAVLAVIILAVVLGLVLARHEAAHSAPSIWVNLTEYPPMPTGVLTYVGPDNTVARSGCTEPSTLWSCSLPKDAQASVAPYRANQPTMVFQIQWDNSSSNGWRVPNGNAPAAVERDSGGSPDGFQPTPSPPSYGEMWFLGETTDGIVSGEKAGEPTPFFISVLPSVNDTQGPVKRASVSSKATGRNQTFSSLLPPPDLEADGTPTAAVMIPNPRQQPVRLFDRGLATEHYGFYTHFKRTIYVKSVTVLNTTEGNVPLDEDGGCRKSEANYLVTWAQTRMLVQIWTRRLGDNTTALLERPGTMPYPVTVTLDTHGGDPRQKLVWDWPMDGRQRLALDRGELLANNMAAGGTWVNHRGSGDVKYGGFDGGTGGCRCEWVNYK